MKPSTLIILSGFCLLTGMARSQEMAGRAGLAHEVSVTTENDAYLFRKHDAYYTNGIFLRLGAAGTRNGKKTIRSYELGQMIYTPLIRKTQSRADIDRPYCGFLFMRYNRTAFTAGDALFQYGATIGVVGSISLGEDLQNSYHKLLGYSRFTGWQYQVQNSIGLDVGVNYARTLWQDAGWAKLVPQVQASLGTNYTNAKLGMNMVIGAFEENGNSALWNARLNRTAGAMRRKAEFFIYWYPEIIFQGYNATLQGGMFAKGTGDAVLAEPERIMWQQTLGLCYASGRWTTKFAWTFQDREANSQKSAQQYGSVLVGYRMR